MIVTLMRHGPCAHRGAGWLTFSNIETWSAAYDAAGLCHEAIPPSAARTVADSAALIVSSDRRRAIESARRVAPGRELEVSSLWREASLPNLTPGGVRLPTMLCLGMSRIAWYFNVTAGPESLAAARARAAVAVTELEQRCRTYGRVLVVGHGIFHRIVAAVLRERGWRGPRQMSAAHWATATFHATVT